MKGKDAVELKKKFRGTVSQAVLDICEKENKTEKEKAHLESETLKLGKQFIEGWTRAFELIIAGFDKFGDIQAIKQLVHGIEKFKLYEGTQKGKDADSFSAVFGFDEELIEKMYHIGRIALNENNFADAAKIFALLVTLEPTFTAAWIALGMSLYNEKLWNESIAVLTIASQLEISNPLPHLYLAKCYKQLGQKADAQEALKHAYAKAQSQSEYRQLVTSIHNEQNNI